MFMLPCQLHFLFYKNVSNYLLPLEYKHILLRETNTYVLTPSLLAPAVEIAE